MKKNKSTRYSEAFKRQVVDEIDRGKFSSPYKAKEAYGIRGNGTIKRWIGKYGREDLLPKHIRIETMSATSTSSPMVWRTFPPRVSTCVTAALATHRSSAQAGRGFPTVGEPFRECRGRACHPNAHLPRFQRPRLPAHPPRTAQPEKVFQTRARPYLLAHLPRSGRAHALHDGRARDRV